MRYYQSDDRTNTCLHVLGNGEVAVGVRGLDIYMVKGNHLAGRNCFSGCVPAEPRTEAYSERIRGRDRWKYRIRIAGEEAGGMEEYLTDRSVFVREFALSRPLRFEIKPDSAAVFDPASCVYTIPKGSYYVNDYPTDHDVCFRVWGEQVEILPAAEGIHITVLGKSRLFIRFGETPEQVLDDSVGEEYNPVCPAVKDTALKDIVEDYWYVFANYRSDCGGVVSAIEWNLAYIRDLYGASRGLLAAGFYREVRELLAFYLGVWHKKGFLATAQSVGTDGSMHIHECDEAENPGYLILQAFDYCEAADDPAFLQELMPMLRWAMEVQARHLYHGMMPFCGDETYVAGNMLPRVHVDDGSCEATMLLIESGRRMAPYEDRAWIRQGVEEARRRFAENFLRDGRLITNNPERRNAPGPAKKKGVCPYCYRYMDGLKPNRYGLYTCPDCAGKTEDIRSDRIYALSCVQMMPAYIHSDLLTAEQQRDIYESLAKDVIRLGCIDGNGAAGKCTGYEYGLLLYGLTVTDSPLRHELFRIVLDSRDEEGIWAEYYVSGKPAGMRWRVWEGGVNLMALLAYERKEQEGNL